jgi:hypothetical protein
MENILYYIIMSGFFESRFVCLVACEKETTMAQVGWFGLQGINVLFEGGVVGLDAEKRVEN